MGFEIITSSPKLPQSNGLAESAVSTAKKILSKCKDVEIGLLSYRTAPLENVYSPAELLMGRKIRSTVPILTENLRPSLPDHAKIQAKEKLIREGMKARYDKRHGARDLSDLHPGCTVWALSHEATGGGHRCPPPVTGRETAVDGTGNLQATLLQPLYW
ncbi:uncharacterized protein LOC129003629 [Macrosteles quadrilineatus]|uniref:uncharacterized protein LOC129003629 n=1 Tax=Macrosteles quadrilineatus TaxID=74068 RepID=UPI0023E2E322|nr:uncharacterized protein LOC129003629 [Macrosteles quadrilineatus]